MRNGMIDLAQAAQWCGGRVDARHAGVRFCGAQFDSRLLRQGELFVALSGQRDGHDFVPAAMAAGAAAVLASKPLAPEIPAIYVEDTRAALQSIAREYRKTLSCTVIGITGSVGKTTTKEMVAAVLETTQSTVKTDQNYNNDLGVPVMLLRLTPQTQAAVLEMGMNHFGELSLLTSLVRPELAVITNVGTMHIENLGSREGILKAKLEILEGLQPGGTCYFCGDNDLLRREAGRCHAVTFGVGEENDVRAVDIRQSEDGIRFTAVAGAHRIPIALPLTGLHHVPDALAAVAVGLKCGVSEARIAEALASFQNTGHRQRILHYGGVTVIDDCYNAGPESMRASLDVLAQAKGRRIAVLGGMLELGDFAPQAHFEIGRYAAERCDLIFVYGTNRADYLRGAGDKARAFQTHEALAEALKPLLRDGDTLLLKGSRGMKMERLLPLLF